MKLQLETTKAPTVTENIVSIATPIILKDETFGKRLLQLFSNMENRVYVASASRYSAGFKNLVDTLK